MKRLSMFVMIAVFTSAQGLLAQTNSLTVTSLIEVLANPEKFDGKRVAVTGFLEVLRDPLHFSSTLFLHEEDAKHFLGNSVRVIPSEAMKKEWEKISSVYVSLTGKVQVVRSLNGPIIQMRDIERCFPLPRSER